MHSLIVGMTESGKSTLAKLLCKQLKAQGKTVAVLDPIYDPDWKVDFRCSTPEELSEYLENHRTAYVFVDECGQVFNDGNDTTYQWFATRSRHWGHSVIFLAQRGIQVPKTMRDQCSRLYLFTSSVDDGKLAAIEWNKPLLATCNTLPAFDFFMASKFGLCEQMRIVGFKDIQRVPDRPTELDNDSFPVGGNRNNRNRGRKMDSEKGNGK